MVRIPDGYEQVPGSTAYRLERHDVCRQGHPIAQVGWGSCPACGAMTMRWLCAQQRCPGIVTATAHKCTASAAT